MFHSMFHPKHSNAWMHAEKRIWNSERRRSATNRSLKEKERDTNAPSTGKRGNDMDSRHPAEEAVSWNVMQRDPPQMESGKRQSQTPTTTTNVAESWNSPSQPPEKYKDAFAYPMESGKRQSQTQTPTNVAESLKPPSQAPEKYKDVMQRDPQMESGKRQSQTPTTTTNIAESLNPPSQAPERYKDVFAYSTTAPRRRRDPMQPGKRRSHMPTAVNVAMASNPPSRASEKRKDIFADSTATPSVIEVLLSAGPVVQEESVNSEEHSAYNRSSKSSPSLPTNRPQSMLANQDYNQTYDKAPPPTRKEYLLKPTMSPSKAMTRHPSRSISPTESNFPINSLEVFAPAHAISYTSLPSKQTTMTMDIRIMPFTLLYQLRMVEPINDASYAQASVVTTTYLENFMERNSNRFIDLEVTDTKSGKSPVTITFFLVMSFTHDSYDTPIFFEAHQYIKDAFSAPLVANLVDELRSLPRTNPFSDIESMEFWGTTDNHPNDLTERGLSGEIWAILILSIAFCVAACVTVTSLRWKRPRRCKRSQPGQPFSCTDVESTQEASSVPILDESSSSSESIYTNNKSDSESRRLVRSTGESSSCTNVESTLDQEASSVPILDELSSSSESITRIHPILNYDNLRAVQMKL